MTLLAILSEITIELVVLLIILGFGIGIISTLSGVGGGFLMVPLYLLLLDFTPMVAKGTSLFVILLSSGVATITHHRKGNLCWRYMIIYAIISIGGSVICSILQEYIIIEKQIFSFIFGFVELLIVIQLIFQTRSQIRRNSLQNQLSTNGEDLKKPQQSSLSQISSDKNESSTQISPNSNNKLSSKLNSLQEKDNQISREMLIGCYSRHDRNKFLPFLFVISGFFSTFLGIGGGIINMPILYGLMGIPIHYASAASTSILFITSIYNVTYYGLLGAINWEIALIMGIGMVLGSYIAAVYAKRVPKMVMITILLGILIYSGIRLLLQTFGI